MMGKFPEVFELPAGYFSNSTGSMIEENRQLATNEPVEFEK